MTINESNSVFIELNPEEAVLVNGGAQFYRHGNVVYKYKNDRNTLVWIGLVNVGTSEVYFPNPQYEPKRRRQATNQALDMMNEPELQWIPSSKFSNTSIPIG